MLYSLLDNVVKAVFLYFLCEWSSYSAGCCFMSAVFIVAKHYGCWTAFVAWYDMLGENRSTQIIATLKVWLAFYIKSCNFLYIYLNSILSSNLVEFHCETLLPNVESNTRNNNDVSFTNVKKGVKLHDKIKIKQQYNLLNTNQTWNL